MAESNPVIASLRKEIEALVTSCGVLDRSIAAYAKEKAEGEGKRNNLMATIKKFEDAIRTLKSAEAS